MYNILKQCPAKKTAHIYGMCMSMATVLSLACDFIWACPNSIYGIHKASSFGAGNSDEIGVTVDLLNIIDTTLIDSYSKKTGISKEELESDYINGFDKWLSPNEALELGFIDAIKDPEQEVITSDYYSNFNTGFDSLSLKAQAANMEDRPFILNLFSNNTNSIMKKKIDVAKTPKVEAVNTSVPTISALDNDVVKALTNEVTNHKNTIGSMLLVNTTLERDNISLKAQLATVKDECDTKVSEAEEKRDTALALSKSKDVENSKLSIHNLVSLSISDMNAPISIEKAEETVSDFINLHLITMANGNETVINKVSNDVSSDIRSAVVNWAKSTGRVPLVKQGLGTATNLDKSVAFDSLVVDSEELQISAYKAELVKNGIISGSPSFINSMISKFEGSNHQYIESLRKWSK